MVALPPGITPKTVTIGVASFFDGSLAEGTVTISAPSNVIHTPTNRPIFSSQMSKRFVDGEASFSLCPTDADGLNNKTWHYKLNVVISGALVQPDPIYFPLPTAGPDVVDLDGLVAVPSSSGTPISVDVLTTEQLPAQMAAILPAQMGTEAATSASPLRTELAKVTVQVTEAPLNPARYGADNTGVADSRLAIQTAVNAARDAGGGTVLIDGTFRVDAPITPRDNVEILGRGWGRSILKPSAAWNGGITGSVLEVGGSLADPIENFSVRNLKMDLSEVPATVQAKGLFVTYMRNLRFENNWILNSTATGIGADFLDASVIRGNRVEGAGRYAEGQEDARLGCSGIGIGTGAWGTEATLVEGNFIYSPVRYGIFVEYQRGISTHWTRFVKILNNHIEGAHWGIGSDGVSWAWVEGNSVYNSTVDGITCTVGNAGALSYGDMIARNRVTGSGRHGIRLDATTDGVTPTRRGHWRVFDNDVWGNVGVGIKVESATLLSHVKINRNSIFENGSIGIDLTGAGLVESEVMHNRIVDNVGLGIRLLGTAMNRLRIVGNRSGDTRSSGKTQTYGLGCQDLGTLTDVDITDNDFRGNATGAISTGGTATTTTVINRNRGYNPQGTDTLAVTASPMTYQVGNAPENLYVIGGAWTSVSLNGVNVATTAPSMIAAQPNDVLVFTYTTVPTAIKRHKL